MLKFKPSQTGNVCQKFLKMNKMSDIYLKYFDFTIAHKVRL